MLWLCTSHFLEAELHHRQQTLRLLWRCTSHSKEAKLHQRSLRLLSRRLSQHCASRPKRPSFTNFHKKLTRRLHEFRICRSRVVRHPRRPRFINLNGKPTRRLCEFGFCRSAVLPAPRRPLQLAELFAQLSDCTRKPIYGLTHTKYPHHRLEFYSTQSISTNTRNKQFGHAASLEPKWLGRLGKCTGVDSLSTDSLSVSPCYPFTLSISFSLHFSLHQSGDMLQKQCK